MAKKEESQLSQVVSALQSMSEFMKSLKDDIDALKADKAQKPVDEGSLKLEDVNEVLKERSLSFKAKMYKVLPYSWEYRDSNGELKKDYRVPWMTFGSYEKAKAYVDSHPEGKFDILPI